jgi:hypothetical protein
MGDLRDRRDPAQQDDLMAPVELIGFSRSKAERHIGRGCRLSAFLVIVISRFLGSTRETLRYPPTRRWARFESTTYIGELSHLILAMVQ